MTALKPLENRRVRAVAAEDYPLNKKCSHPECDEDAVDPHHAFPRSAIGGASWFVQITEDDGTYVVIPHVTGLCRVHHDAVEEHDAWIKLEEGVWSWFDREKPAEGKGVRPSDPTWKDIAWEELGPLNPQPGSTEGKPKRKRFKGEARKKRKTISLRVPDTADEDGAALFDEAIETLEEKLCPGNHRPVYFTIMAALDYTNLNADATDFE